MLSFVLRRIGVAILTLVTVAVLAFSLAWLSGDPAIAIAGEGASAQDIVAVRRHYGLDQPVHVQFGAWLSNALSGNFGSSYHFRMPVSDMIVARLPVTMALGALALSFAILIAVPLGILAAVYANTIVDRLALVVAVLGQAVPTFWFSLMMIILFGVILGWLPVSGTGTWAHFVMPTIALGYFATPALMRLTRAGMIEALSSDYVRTAKAYGLSRGSILVRHSLRNAVVPVVALAAVQFGNMLGGSIVVETVFSLQGVGWLAYDAILRGDLPVVQAILLVVACFYIVLNLAADLLNGLLDPRIRVTE